MEKRPLFVFSIAIFAGVFSAGLRPWYMNYAALILAPLVCIVYCILRFRQLLAARSDYRYFVELIAIMAVIAILPTLAYIDCVNLWKGRLLSYSEYDGKEIEAIVKIKSPAERTGNKLRYVAEPISINDEKLAGNIFRPIDRFYLYISDNNERDNYPRLVYGTVTIVRGRLAKPTPQQNEYLFDYQTYMFSKQITANLYIEAVDPVIVSTPLSILGIPVNPIGAGIAIRERIANVFAQVFPAREAALIAAILLGNTDNLDEESYNDFAASGLLHLMAVSGLHIMIVSKLATAMVKRLGFGAGAGRALSILIITVFVFIAGFSPSVVRAALSYGLAALSDFSGRAYDRLNALGVAAISLLIYNPMQAFGAGFLLSFSSALSIHLFSINIRSIPILSKVPRFITESIAISVAICIGCYPIQVTLFHSYSMVTILSNLLCVPLVTGVLGMGAAISAIGLCSIALATIPALVAMNFLWMLERVAALTASIPNALIRVGAFGAPVFLLYYSIVFVVFAYAKSRAALTSSEGNACKRTPTKGKEAVFLAFAVVMSIILALTCLFRAGIQPGEMEVVFLDVGNSNAAYINIEGRYNVIVDAGGSAASMYGSGVDDPTMLLGEKRISEYLAGRGIGSIDIAIATHGDIDHIQGFWHVIDNMPVKRLLLPSRSDAQLEALAAFAQDKGAQVLRCSAGDIVNLGSNASIEILSPIVFDDWRLTDPTKAPVNDYSIVAKIVFGEMKTLFCGDISATVETELLGHTEPGDLASQLICVPHHGSKYSSCEAFVAHVAPEVAVAGVGKNNYGHPSPEAMERYAAAGALFLRTDRDGMIKALCDMNGIKRIWRFNDIENCPAWQRNNIES